MQNINAIKYCIRKATTSDTKEIKLGDQAHLSQNISEYGEPDNKDAPHCDGQIVPASIRERAKKCISTRQYVTFSPVHGKAVVLLEDLFEGDDNQREGIHSRRESR